MFFERIKTGLDEDPAFSTFTFRDVNPVSGRSKSRTVANLNPSMRVLQRRFLKLIRTQIDSTRRKHLLRYTTSSNPGDSPLRNVSFHRHQRYMYALDFKSAYGSVKPAILSKVLVDLGICRPTEIEELETFLRRYFFVSGLGLAPGGNASQDLFNLYTATLVDEPLAHLLETEGVTYTRYLDDLTFSSDSPIGPRTRRKIREVILDAHFNINHRKCECVDTHKRTIIVTGIGIAQGGRLFVPRPYVLKLRGLIHRARTKKDVDVRRVKGMMQLFLRISTGQHGNALERKVQREYNELNIRP